MECEKYRTVFLTGPTIISHRNVFAAVAVSRSEKSIILHFRLILAMCVIIKVKLIRSIGTIL